MRRTKSSRKAKPPLPRLDALLFAQDVRFEVGGFLTVVGMHPGNLHVDVLPTNLRFNIVAIFDGLAGCSEFAVQFSVLLEEERLVQGETVKCKKASSETRHTVVHPIVPFPLPRAGTYVIETKIKTEGGTRSFSKSFVVARTPSVTAH